MPQFLRITLARDTDHKSEVAIGAGASRVVVWIGPELDDQQIRQKLDGG